MRRVCFFECPIDALQGLIYLQPLTMKSLSSKGCVLNFDRCYSAHWNVVLQILQLKQSRSLLSDSLATISLLETNAHLLQKRRDEYKLERITLKADVEREKRAYERVADESRDAEITAGRLEVKRQRLEDEKMGLAIKHVQEKEKMVAEREEVEKVFREEREMLQKENEQLKTKLEQSKKLIKELVKKEPYRRAKTVGTDNDSD